jgi:hypothetical protein
LVYAGDVNLLDGSIYSIEKNTDSLVVSNKENGLEVNADKTKYMFMSRYYNARGSDNIKIYNSFFEMVQELRYLGTTLKNQNYTQKKIKNRFKSGNICYHSVQNLFIFQAAI